MINNWYPVKFSYCWNMLLVGKLMVVNERWWNMRICIYDPYLLHFTCMENSGAEVAFSEQDVLKISSFLNTLFKWKRFKEIWTLTSCIPQWMGEVLPSRHLSYWPFQRRMRFLTSGLIYFIIYYQIIAASFSLVFAAFLMRIKILFSTNYTF